MFAGIVSFAFINLVLAVISFVAFITLAGVATDTIHAGTWTAGIAVTFVDVYLTILTGDTLHAKALVPIEISKTYSFDIRKNSKNHRFQVLLNL